MPVGLLARWSLVATLLLVAVGGFTRGSGSGYGCADRWPLCENGALGGLLPRWEYHMIIEWSHRWLAGLVGLLVLTTAVVAWRKARDRPLVVTLATIAVVVVVGQAWVGRLVVTGQLAGDLVTLHLTISMILVTLLTVLVVTTGDQQTTPPADLGWPVLVGTAALASFGLLLLGSAVHNLYFPGWPLMHGGLLPDLGSTAAIFHFAHRALAGILLLYLGLLAVKANRGDLPEPERRLVLIAAVLYLLNIGLGAAHVLTKVSSALLVAAHLGVAAVVLSLLVSTTAMATYRWKGHEKARRMATASTAR